MLKVETNAGEVPAPVPACPSPLRRKETFSGGKEKEVSHKENEASKVQEGFLFVYLRFLCDFAEKKLFTRKRKGGSAQRKRSFKGSRRIPLRVPSFPLRLRRKKTFSGGKEKEVSHKENEASKVHKGFLFVLLRFLCDFAEKKLFRRKRKGGLAQRKRSFNGSRRGPLRASSFPLRLRRKKTFREEKKRRFHTKKTKLQRFTKGSSSCSCFLCLFAISDHIHSYIFIPPISIPSIGLAPFLKTYSLCNR